MRSVADIVGRGRFIGPCRAQLELPWSFYVVSELPPPGVDELFFQQSLGGYELGQSTRQFALGGAMYVDCLCNDLDLGLRLHGRDLTRLTFATAAHQQTRSKNECLESRRRL